MNNNETKLRIAEGENDLRDINSNPSNYSINQLLAPHLSRLKKVSDIQKFAKFAQETLQILYKWLPQDLFERYCTNQCSDVDHDLGHAIEVLGICSNILPSTPINAKLLTYGVLLHDISNITSRHVRYGHHNVSAQWTKVILNREMQETNPICSLTFDEIETICEIIIGHKKINTPKQPRPEHDKYLEARILHDADMISSCLDPHKIYRIRLYWSIKDTNESDNTNYTIDHYQTPLTINRFYNKNEGFTNRITVIKENRRYNESDGVTDLFVKIVWRSSRQYYENYYLTQEAKSYIQEVNKEKARDIRSLVAYIEEQRHSIKNDYGLIDIDIDKIKEILTGLNNEFQPLLF